MVRLDGDRACSRLVSRDVDEVVSWQARMLASLDVDKPGCWQAWMLASVDVGKPECWQTRMLAVWKLLVGEDEIGSA